MIRNIKNHINLMISTSEKYEMLSDEILHYNIYVNKSEKIIRNTSLQVELYKPGNVNNYAYLVIEYTPNNSNNLGIQVKVNSQLSLNKKNNDFQLNDVFWGILNGNDRFGDAILATAITKAIELNYPSGILSFKSGAYREDTGTSCALMEKMTLFMLELLDKNIDLLSDDEIVEIWRKEYRKTLIYKA